MNTISWERHCLKKKMEIPSSCTEPFNCGLWYDNGRRRLDNLNISNNYLNNNIFELFSLDASSAHKSQGTRV